MRWAALGAALAAIAIVFTASRAPADYSLELGQTIEIRAKAGSALPQGEELAALVHRGLASALHQGRPRQLELRILRDDSGAEVVRISVWGAPIAGVLEELRARVPTLTGADLTVRTVEGRVHTNLAGLLAHRVLQSDDAIEQLRQQVREELRKDGVPGDGAAEIEVELDGKGGHRVTVRMRALSPR